MGDERYFPEATVEQLREAARACRNVKLLGAEDGDWDAPEAAEARRLTKALGWSWDFTSWSDAASILEFEATLAEEIDDDDDIVVVDRMTNGHRVQVIASMYAGRPVLTSYVHTTQGS